MILVTRKLGYQHIVLPSYYNIMLNVTRSPRLCYQAIKRNTELNTCGILASTNVSNL